MERFNGTGGKVRWASESFHASVIQAHRPQPWDRLQQLYHGRLDHRFELLAVKFDDWFDQSVRSEMRAQTEGAERTLHTYYLL